MKIFTHTFKVDVDKDGKWFTNARWEDERDESLSIDLGDVLFWVLAAIVIWRWAL